MKPKKVPIRPDFHLDFPTFYDKFKDYYLGRFMSDRIELSFLDKFEKNGWFKSLETVEV